MLGLRLTALAFLVAGCGALDVPVATESSALDSCDGDNDCPLPASHGTCVKAVCNNHACEYAMDTTACPTGCTVATQLTDCNLGGTNCFIVKCTATNVCDFSDYSASSGCQCTTAVDCAAANACQNAATCNSATCTYTAKQPLAQPCCNVDANCGGTGTKCVANTCGCISASDKFCSGAAPGDGRCVPSTGCCVATDCAAGNSCQTRMCSMAGACSYVSNGNSGCCDDATADCGGTATCTNNTCTCGTGQKFCPGSSPGNGSCIANSACCADSDCAARANATVVCNAHACVYTCNSGFHDCSGVCKDDTSVLTCGNSCTACPSGNACQTATCNGNSCGFASSGASPCCNSPTDCTPGNACQQATACDNNTCVFGSTGADGCCNKPDDCAAPTDSCLMATCVANQCATAPVPDCMPDGGAADMATPNPGDLAGLSVGGGGCALAGQATSSHAPALFIVALLLLALSFRRRSA